MTARDRLTETLAIIGFYVLVFLAVVALFRLAPWWLAVPALAACSGVMVRRADP